MQDGYVCGLLVVDIVVERYIIGLRVNFDRGDEAIEVRSIDTREKGA